MDDEPRPYESDMITPPEECGRCKEHPSICNILHEHHTQLIELRQRLDDYWGRDLPINRGRWNFDRVRYDYYRDQTVAIERIFQ